MRTKDFGVRGVGHVSLFVHQCEKVLHVDHGLANFPVHRAQNIEWDRDLQQVGIDHDEITHRHISVADIKGGKHKHQCYTECHDTCLCHVQQRKTFSGAHGGLFVIRQCFIQTGDFVRFVVEVADRLKVEQRIHGSAADVIFGVIHFAADPGPPGGDHKSQPYIQRDSDDRDRGVDKAKKRPEYSADQQQFDDGGNHIEGDERQQKADAVRAPIDKAVESASFAGKMKTDRERMKMLEHSQCQRPHGVLSHPGKECIT